MASDSGNRGANATARGPLLQRSGKALVACIVGLLLFAAIDLWSKQWAIDALSLEPIGEPPPVCEVDEHGRMHYQRRRGPPIVLVEDYLELRYAENCGAAFGLMRDAPLGARRAVFGLAALLASVALLWMFVRGRGGRAFAWSVPFIVSGAVGNLVDRVRYGYVVDFIRFHVEQWNWEYPTFNIADSTITVGVVLLLFDGILEGRREKARQAQQQRRRGTSDEAEEQAEEAQAAEKPARDEASGSGER